MNVNCTSYMDLIDMRRVAVTDTNPPVVRDVLVTEENIEFLSCERILDHEFGSWLEKTPVHTQCVERSVQLVTKASKVVSGERNRDGLIANTIASRNAMPKFNSKQDYNVTETSKYLVV